MNQNIAVMSGKQTCCLHAAHIVICVDAGYIPVFTLDGYHRNLQIGQFSGRQRKAQDNKALNIVGQKFIDILALGFFLLVSDKDKEFIAEMLIGKENPV